MAFQLLANPAVVSFSRMASSGNFALNAVAWHFRSIMQASH